MNTPPEMVHADRRDGARLPRTWCKVIQPLYNEFNYIYGLGGRDVRVESIREVYEELKMIVETGKTGKTYRYLNVRE